MRNNLIYIYVFYYFFILTRTLLSRTPFFPCYRKYRDVASARWESIKSDPRFNLCSMIAWGVPGPGNTRDCVQRSLGSFLLSHKAKTSLAVRSLRPAISIHNLLFNFKLQNPWHPLILSYLRTSDFNLLSKNWGPRLTASFSSPETSATSMLSNGLR